MVDFAFSLSCLLIMGVMSCNGFERGEKNDRMDLFGVGDFGLYVDTYVPGLNG